MEINLAIVKSLASIDKISEDKKPCYLLIPDTTVPQLFYFPKNDALQKIPFNQHDLKRFKLDKQLADSIDSFPKLIPLSVAQKETIHRTTGHVAVDLSQDNLIERINYYLKINNYEVQMDEMGVCQGLATVYCKYVTEKKKENFFALLKQIATTPQPEFKKNNLELNSFIQETVFAASPGEFNKNLGQSDGLENIKVQNPDLFDKSSKSAHLKKIFKFSAVTTSNHWENILQDIKFEGATYLVNLPYHAISMSYQGNKFHLYDPNYENGEKLFSSEQEVFKEIAQIIIGINLINATRYEGEKIKLPTLGKSVEIQYNNDKYYLYDNANPDNFKEFANLDDLAIEITNSFVNEKKFMLDMAISVAENPYNPIHHQFPEKTLLLDTLRQAQEEYNENLTIGWAIKEKDSELADELLDNLVDPGNQRLFNFLLNAFEMNAHGWLIKILNHPKISVSEQTRRDVLNELLNSNSIGNDKSLKILLEHPSFQSTPLDIAQKSSFLRQAISSKNPKSVNIILRHCSQEELTEIISDELISLAANQGSVDLLDLLLNNQHVDEKCSGACLFFALEHADFKMVNYLINKYPEHELESTPQLMPFDLEQKINLLKQAITTKNESNVALILSMCQDEGEIAAVTQKCFSKAVLTNDLETINYLIEKFPQHHLVQSYNMSAELIQEHQINPEIVLLLIEKGLKYVDSEINRVKFSIYVYSVEQTPENLDLFRSEMSAITSAHAINFLVDRVEDEKIDLATLFQNIFLNKDFLLGIEVIKELAQREALYASRCDIIQNFMSTLIEQKNNDALHVLLSIEPPLPLDYSLLYEKAKIVKTAYDNDWWPALTFAAKPDEKVLLKLQERIAQQQWSAEDIPMLSPLAMLKIKTEQQGLKFSVKSRDKSIPPDALKEETSSSLKEVKEKAPVIESPAKSENEDTDAPPKRGFSSNR